MPADAVIVRADRRAVGSLLVREDVDRRIAGQGELLLCMALRLAEARHEMYQLLRSHVLAAKQNRAMVVEDVNHRIERPVIGLGEVDSRYLRAETGLELGDRRSGYRVHLADPLSERPIAGHRHSVTGARVGEIVPDGLMPSATIVPEGHRVGPPAESALEIRVAAMFVEIAQDRAALVRSE